VAEAELRQFAAPGTCNRKKGRIKRDAESGEQMGARRKAAFRAYAEAPIGVERNPGFIFVQVSQRSQLKKEAPPELNHRGLANLFILQVTRIGPAREGSASVQRQKVKRNAT
jgi:hypothetical protein